MNVFTRILNTCLACVVTLGYLGGLIWTTTWGAAAHANTDWQNNRLAVLRKVTVGPWDNFEASVSADSKQLFYTRDKNQIPQIFRQDLVSTESSLYIGDSGDAKQPVLSPGGDRLAITYYGNDAQGDVCIVTLQNKDINCVTDDKTADESPFWVNNSSLGYISRESSRLERQLIVLDLKHKTGKTLKSGAISAPSASPDGKYILFNITNKNGSVDLYLHDTTNTSTKQMAAIDLPGITGYTTFSRDNQYVYFNHYLNDTNADQVIDANDHSVVFRLKLSDWLMSKERIFPEQLTSVENNCKFPVVTAALLYVTCAFEASLDIYRLPLHGMVPAKWTETQVNEAHSIARSYQERLLLINVLRYRFNKHAMQMIERLLSNHLEIGEYTAASYYVEQLVRHYEAQRKTKLATFYRALGQLLNVRSSRQTLPTAVVTAGFQKLVAEQRKAIQSSLKWAELTELVNIYLDYALQNNRKAINRLKHIDLSASMLPLQRYLSFAIIQLLLEREQPKKMLTYYPTMFNQTEVSQQAKLYYAFHFLKLLANTSEDIESRIQAIEMQKSKASDKAVVELLQTEIVSLKLARTPDDKQKVELFNTLKVSLKNSKSNALLRKVLHTSAIRILGEAEQFKYMELLSRHWLISTHINEMDFVNVAEQYALITMDKGYGMLANKEFTKAYNTFYSAIRQTNDLESHYQFITLGLNPELKRHQNLDKSYNLLAKQKILGQNEKYVQALRLIIDTEDIANPGQSAQTAYDLAITQLKSMRVEGLNPAIRDLLLGYIYHKKFRAAKQGFKFDKSLFKKAHYHYMMALDLGRDNTRIVASSWENLAWLQFEVRQYALAADFFAKRLQFPFTDRTAELNTRWSYARALFYNNQPADAAQQAETALKLAHAANTDPTPYLEKAAFYAVQAGLYQQAATHYEALFSDAAFTTARHNDGALNLAKAKMAYSYALIKLKQPEKAQRHLKQLTSQLSSLKPLAADNNRLLAFHPDRLLLLANGFLAQLSPNPRDKVQYRNNRIAIWKSMRERTKEFAYKEEDRLAFMIKDYQYVAYALAQQSQFADMAEPMQQSILLSKQWLDETGDHTGPVIYRSLVNYLSTFGHYKIGISKDSVTLVNDICKATLSAYARLTFRPAIINDRERKLHKLCDVYSIANAP